MKTHVTVPLVSSVKLINTQLSSSELFYLKTSAAVCVQQQRQSDFPKALLLLLDVIQCSLVEDYTWV